MVPIVRVGVGDELRIGDGIQQAATENRERASKAAAGCVLGEGLLVDSQRGLERRRRMLLNDGAAFARELVADSIRVKCRGVHFHFVSHSAGYRVFVALSAGGGIE